MSAMVNEDMDQPDAAPYIACNLHRFSAEQRKQYNILLAELAPIAGQVRELGDGYEIAFPVEAAISVAEFVALERLCCPFLTFTMQLAPASSLRLSLAGPDGAKEILSEFVWVADKQPPVAASPAQC